MRQGSLSGSIRVSFKMENELYNLNYAELFCVYYSNCASSLNRWALKRRNLNFWPVNLRPDYRPPPSPYPVLFPFSSNFRGRTPVLFTRDKRTREAWKYTCFRIPLRSRFCRSYEARLRGDGEFTLINLIKPQKRKREIERKASENERNGGGGR